MKILKKWWFWLIIVTIIVLIGILTNNSSPVGCSYQANQIDHEVKSANYCSVESDCKVLPLGGQYVEFGCYHYINKDIDGEKIYKKMDDYWNRCTKIIDDCAVAPFPKCLNNKCVENI